MDISGIAPTLAKVISDKLGPFLHARATEAVKKGRLLEVSTYEAYLRSICEHYEKARTFFDRENATYIYDFYVPLSVRCSASELHDASLSELLKFGNKLVVTGLAGAGKSILMKHFLLECFRKTSKIPVFVELRTFSKEPLDVLDAIHKSLSKHRLEIDKNLLKEALGLGCFCVLLDGFDEIDPAIRPSSAENLKTFAASLSCTFLVSSRPDPSFTGWDGWSMVSMLPLSEDEACTLIAKASYNEEAKRLFATKLRGGLYKSHKSFLSNPLLLSIMLLTFDHNAEIPSKLSIFYSRAYDALYSQHDALKGGFLRSRKTGLDISDFGRMFAAFSLLTYFDRQVRFSYSYALLKVKQASQLTGIQVSPEDYVTDAKQGVCLLVDDGLDISYTHRSFQEYFAARFISERPDDVKERLMSRLSASIRQDSVVSQLYELDPDGTLKYLLLPRIEKFFSRFGMQDDIGLEQFKRFMLANYKGIVLIRDDDWGLSLDSPDRRGDDLDLFHFLVDHFVGAKTSAHDREPLVKKFKEIIVQEGGKARDEHHFREDSPYTDEVLKTLIERGGRHSIRTLEQIRQFYELNRKLLSEKQVRTHELLGLQ